MKRLLVINGHPDPRPERFCGALCRAYEHGGKAGGWETRCINLGELPLSSVEAVNRGEDPDTDILDVLSELDWANRLAIIYPLWFDQTPPALQAVFNADSAISVRPGARKAHLIVTMEMPAFAYRSLLRAGKAAGLAIPGVVAQEPVLIGCVNTIAREQRRAWLEMIRRYGERSTLGTTAAPSRSFAAMIDRTVAQWWHG